MNVVLTYSEQAMACWVGGRRRLASIKRGDKETGGCYNKPPEYCYYVNVKGACGECATAKGLQRYWPMSVNVDNSYPDVLPDIQVRTAQKDDARLKFKEGWDKPNFRYVLTIGEIESFRLVGWLWGHEFALVGVHDDPGGIGKPAMWAKQVDLHPMTDLIAVYGMEESITP